MPIAEKTAPDLSDVGSRIHSEYLQRFLADPSVVHPGTTMPNVLASKTLTERQEISEALTHFLIAQSRRPFQNDAAEKIDASGKELFHSVGCVACHTPREAIANEYLPEDFGDSDDETPTEGDKQPRSLGVSLEHIPAKYGRKSLSEFLFQPLRVRSAGRMPDMKLTPTESRAIAGYLLGELTDNRSPLQPQDRLVAQGRKYFQEFNCAACHTLDGMSAKTPIGSLRAADPTRGCLSQTPGKAPHYDLDDAQIAAIAASFKESEAVSSDPLQVAFTLTAFNCIACHVRDDFGGVAEDRNAYFRTSERNLGDDGRIPPPLTLVGAKLQPVWLKKVLLDGESVRPYMATRMPQYGEPNLGHLPEILHRIDDIPPIELRVPNPESELESERDLERKLRPAGQALLGDQGLNCIACHNFNGKPAPLNKGMDLMTTHQRLQPAWFDGFVRNPGRYRPRIIMPYAWPDGVAAHRTILDGDTELQIEAIWYYLSLGTSAADPPGIRRQETQLEVTDTVRTYRGRSGVAGYRGIAVGYPERLSYAFNAETGTLTAIWKDGFIRVDRSGQGSGGFHPAGAAIAFAQDVSFVDLDDERTPWPLLPKMTEKNRENPNPLYPKNLGYQFKGYYFDSDFNPTLMYQTGNIVIEDRSAVEMIGDRRTLRRAMEFNSPITQVVWFRALTGAIDVESERVFKTKELRLTVPKTRSIVRPHSEIPDASELLLRLEIPQGKSKIEFAYELL
jgi:mono/diheme cytochrome c family protein